MFLKLFLQTTILYNIISIIPLIINHIYSRISNKKVHNNIKHKWILITGATDGIGKALAIQFAKLKYKLIIVGRNEDKLRIVEDELRNYTNGVIYKVHDFNQACDFSDLLKYDISLLVNNAGVSYNGPQYFINDNMEEIINVNIMNTFKITKIVLSKMIDCKMGYVINIGSITGDIPMPLLSSYAASKCMLRSWSESLYYECGKYNVNVECMDTGYVATKMSRIRRSNLFCPEPNVYAKCIVNHFGSSGVSFAYWPHLVLYCLLMMVPRWLLGKFAYLFQERRRKIILKKINKK